MKFNNTLAVAGAALALGAMPALALAHTTPSQASGAANAENVAPAPPANQGTAHKPATPGPKAGMPAKIAAYGKDCQNESKQHVAGQQGTPFSQCVTAMAKIATSTTTTSPQSACRDESKHHVAGQHGTPYSLCVSSAAKLRRQQSSDSTTTTS